MTSQIDKTLPADPESEKLVLASILLDGDRFPEIAGALQADDFSLETNRRIFRRMADMDGHGKAIDHVTVAGELHGVGELESVGGVSYLVSLDDGMPHLANLDAYVDRVIEKSRLRRIAAAAQHILNRALTAGETPDDILAGADTAMLDIRPSRNTKEAWKTPGMVIAEYPGGLKGMLEPPADGTALSTPFARLNEAIGGFRRQELILLAGRPSHGKSAAGLQFAWHAVNHHRIEIAYISLEMSQESLVQRLISIHGNADLHRMRIGFLSRDERMRLSLKASDIQEAKFWIDDRGGQTSAGMRRSIRQLCSRRPIGLVVVDHLHLIRGADQREDERRRFSRIADDLQVLAKDLNVPVIALAQCSRRCEEENRPPGMPDLKETGKLEENADLILFAYRPEMYHKNRNREELRGVAEFVVAKQRSGPVGSVHVTFLGSQSKFANRAEDVPEQGNL